MESVTLKNSFLAHKLVPCIPCHIEYMIIDGWLTTKDVFVLPRKYKFCHIMSEPNEMCKFSPTYLSLYQTANYSING